MENIEVAVRVRPLNQKEIKQGEESAWQVESNEKNISLIIQQNKLSSPPAASRGTRQQSTTKNSVHQQLTSSMAVTSSQQNLNGQSVNILKQEVQNAYNNQKSHQQLSKAKKALNQILTKTESTSSLHSQQQTQASLAGVSNESKKKTNFNFDVCFKEDSPNHQIYISLVKRIALSSLNGINGTVFVYGQTGSGKTYTMLGRERKEIMISSQETKKPKTPSKASKVSSQKESQVSSQQTMGETHSQIDMEVNYLSGKSQLRYPEVEEPGVLIYALQDIFREIAADQEKTYFLRCSYVEIYNEQVYDLLRGEESLGEALQLAEDKTRDFYIRGVTEEPISSIEEILYILRRGELNRHYAETKLNHNSSRSHTLFRVLVQSITRNFLEQQQQQTGYSPLKTSGGLQQDPNLRKYVSHSILNFVDLAGSEKVSSHYDNKEPDEIYVQEFGEQGPRIDAKVRNRIQEGKNINKSLFFLTQVISMRAEAQNRSMSPIGGSNSISPMKQNQSFQSQQQQQMQHIPYRNSPLTKILRSSLGGNARTSVIVCMTPARSQMEQSLSSLRFGQNAMQISNRVTANIISNNNEEAVKVLIADYERRIRGLERAKKDQQVKREQELKVIEQLIEEKRKMQDRVNAQNVKRQIKGAQCSLKILHENIKVHKNFPLIMETIGILELSDKLQESYIVKIPQGQKDPLLEDQIDFLTQCYRQITNTLLEQQKFQHQVYRDQLTAKDRLNHEINFQNSELDRKLRDAIQLMSDQRQNIKEEVDKLEKQNSKLKLKESFYEEFKPEYLKMIDDKNLTSLEQHFAQILDQIKNEKTKRYYRYKIERVQEELKSQIKGVVDDDYEEDYHHRQAVENAIHTLQQSEQQSIIIEQDQLDSIKSVQQLFIQQQDPSHNHHMQEELQKLDQAQLLIQQSLETNLNYTYQPAPFENPSERSSIAKFDTIDQEIEERDLIIREYEQQLELISRQLEGQGVSDALEQRESIQQDLTQQFYGSSKQLEVTHHSNYQQPSSTPHETESHSSQCEISHNSFPSSLSSNFGNHLRYNESLSESVKKRLIQNSDSLPQDAQGLFAACGQTESSLLLSSNAFNGLLKDFVDSNQQQLQNICCDGQTSFQYEHQHKQSDQGVQMLQESPTLKSNKVDGSFAMTHRESNQDMNGNNLFETLQANINTYNHQMIVNSQDYVSFKQASNKKHIFIQNEEDEFEVKVHKKQESGILSINNNKLNSITDIESILRNSAKEIQSNMKYSLHPSDFGVIDNSTFDKKLKDTCMTQRFETSSLLKSVNSAKTVNNENINLKSMRKSGISPCRNMNHTTSLNKQNSHTPILKDKSSQLNKKQPQKKVSQLLICGTKHNKEIKSYQPLLQSKSRNQLTTGGTQQQVLKHTCGLDTEILITPRQKISMNPNVTSSNNKSVTPRQNLY